MTNQEKKIDSLFVSVVIPCRNEEKFIGECLESVVKQAYPNDNLEILIIDGMSEDKTRGIIVRYQEKYPFVRLLDNYKKITPAAFNVGIKESKGDYIVLMGAHAHYDRNYVSVCVASLLKNCADNVGGRAIVLPSCDTVSARAIAFSISSVAGSAGAVYKTETGGVVREVDTVFGGCYKRGVFKKIGYFNERLRRTQDLELNIRLIKSGGKIIFDPAITAYYYSKAVLTEFLLYNLECGKWAVYSWRITGQPLKLRQYIPLFFVSCMFIVLILRWQIGLLLLFFYVVALAIFAVKVALREKDWRLEFPLMVALIYRHFGYGIGSLAGLLKIIFCPLRKEF